MRSVVILCCDHENVNDAMEKLGTYQLVHSESSKQGKICVLPGFNIITAGAVAVYLCNVGYSVDGNSASCAWWHRAVWRFGRLRKVVFSGLSSEVHFAREESGMQWINYLFDLQNAVECRIVMSRCPDERARMHSMIYLLSTCESMSNRELDDDGAAWVLQCNEQQQRDRAAGVKDLFNMLDTTISGRAKELVKQGLSDRNGMIAFEEYAGRFGKTAGVAKLTDVFQSVWKTRG